MSDRCEKPFIEVNCAAIPEELIESELFGHEKGSFSDATAKKRGKFEVADKGTIFLDEIGDMSVKTQAKILRILQERKFERVGGSRTLTVDVRVLAASNKDLEKEIDKGTFREDLYYRLNVIPIFVPPLRNRAEDIPLLAQIFLKEFAEQGDCKPKRISEKAIRLLQAYSWPGNVRELKNLIERLAIMTRSEVIDANDIPLSYKQQKLPQEAAVLFTEESLKDARKEFEKSYIQRKLREHGGNISQAADSMGIERSHLYKKIKAFEIKL
jgi:two-component system nitrogen regulation response regulator NtrX